MLECAIQNRNVHKSRNPSQQKGGRWQGKVTDGQYPYVRGYVRCHSHGTSPKYPFKGSDGITRLPYFLIGLRFITWLLADTLQRVHRTRRRRSCFRIDAVRFALISQHGKRVAHASAHQHCIATAGTTWIADMSNDDGLTSWLQVVLGVVAATAALCAIVQTSVYHRSMSACA